MIGFIVENPFVVWVAISIFGTLEFMLFINTKALIKKYGEGAYMMIYGFHGVVLGIAALGSLYMLIPNPESDPSCKPGQVCEIIAFFYDFALMGPWGFIVMGALAFAYGIYCLCRDSTKEVPVGPC